MPIEPIALRVVDQARQLAEVRAMQRRARGDRESRRELRRSRATPRPTVAQRVDAANPLVERLGASRRARR